MDKDKKEVGQLVPNPDNDRLGLGEADGMTTFHKPKKKPPGIKPTARNRTKPTAPVSKPGLCL